MIRNATDRPKRIVDRKALKRARQRTHCEHCGERFESYPFYRSCSPHHIKSRGAGGPDSDENLISLCGLCHDLAHRAKISRERLREIVAERKEIP